MANDDVRVVDRAFAQTALTVLRRQLYEEDVLLPKTGKRRNVLRHIEAIIGDQRGIVEGQVQQCINAGQYKRAVEGLTCAQMICVGLMFLGTEHIPNFAPLTPKHRERSTKKQA